MRMITAALAGAAIFLSGCGGNIAPDEESGSAATADDEQEAGAESDEGETDEEADQE